MLVNHNYKNFQEIIDLLHLNRNASLRKVRNYYMLRCPCSTHGDDGVDSIPSLKLSFNKKAGLKVYCYAGCETEDIIKGLIEIYGIPKEKLEPLINIHKISKEKNSEEFSGCTLKDLYPDVLVERAKNLGVYEELYKGKLAVVFPLLTPDNKTYKLYRIGLEGKNKYRLENGAPASQLLFIVPVEPNFKAGIITESPNDALTFAILNPFWLSIAGVGKINTVKAIKAHRDRLLDLFKGKPIYVWVEPDAKGLAEKIAEVLGRKVYKVGEELASPFKDAWRILKERKDPVHVKQYIEKLLEKAEEISPFGIKTSTFKDILDEELQKEWIIEKTVGLGEVWLILGHPNIGKTTLCLNFVKAFDQGENLLGKKFAKKKCVYIFYEKIVPASETASELGIGDLPILDGNKYRINLSNLKSLDYLAEEEGYEIFFIDPFIDFLNLKEPNALYNYYQMAKILDPLKDFVLKRKVTIFGTYHPRKTSEEKEVTETDILGSIALAAKLDGKILLTKRGDIIIAKIKSNRIPEEEIKFRWEGKVPKLVIFEDTKKSKIAQYIIKFLKSEEKATWSDLLKYLQQVSLAETNIKTLKKQFNRALEFLLDKKIIKKQDNKFYFLDEETLSSLQSAFEEDLQKI